MADLRRGNELAAGRRFVEVLAEVPRAAMVLAPLLQVAARHVQADGVAEDVVVGPLHVDAPPTLAKGDDELGLVVIVGALCRIVHLGAARDECELALQEEERCLAAIAAHLLLMLGVVAPDAENAPYRELLGAARDRQRGRRPQGNCVSHGVLEKPQFYSVYDHPNPLEARQIEARAQRSEGRHPARADRLPPAS